MVSFNADDLLVTDRSIDVSCNTCTVARFFEMASSEEGLDIDGDLYVDINSLSESQYNTIAGAIDFTIFIAQNEDSVPEWCDRTKLRYLEDKVDVVVVTEPKPIEEPKAEPVAPAPAPEPTPEPVEQQNEAQSNDFGVLDFDSYENTQSNDPNFDKSIQNLFDGDARESDMNENHEEAKVFTFGSSKGGTGKTFTALICAYRYAKTHPNERVAMIDLDIIDSQIGISIHTIRPTLMGYFKLWSSGMKDFKTMRDYRIKTDKFPPNLDFYLPPKDYFIQSSEFWINVLENLLENYDCVICDTGIDYINYLAISYAYKIADKINLVSTTSIKSVSSVLKQIAKLKGLSSSANTEGKQVYTKEDNLASKLNLIITQCDPKDSTNKMIFDTFNKNINIVGIFGYISSKIQEVEYHNKWNLFDDSIKFNETLDEILSLENNGREED